MAGRWMMATIQFTFAVQPAIIYWLAGQSFIGTSISIGTVVAFTTLQTRLLFPIQSLLGVQADMQTSLALFDRIFEYLDLPVDIVEAEHPVELRPERAARRGAVRGRVVPLRRQRRRRVDAARRRPGRSRRDPHRGRGRDRRRQDDARLSGRAAVRAPAGPGDDRRGRRARRVARVAGGDGRRRLAGDLPVPRERAREPAVRAARTRPTRRSRTRRGRRGSTT